MYAVRLHSLINRRWFGIVVGIIIISALLYAFALIFAWLPKSDPLNILWEFLRFGLAGSVLFIWGMLNVSPPRPAGFVIAFAELGEEKVEDGGNEGLVRPVYSNVLSRRKLTAKFDEDKPLSAGSSRFLNELRRMRKAEAVAQLPVGKIPAALPPGSLNKTQVNPNLALAPTKQQYSGGDGANAASSLQNSERIMRSGLVNFGDDDASERPPVPKQIPPTNFFDWENAVGALGLTNHLRAKVQEQVNETGLKEAVSFYPLIFVKDRATALHEGIVPQADAVIWGWNSYRKRRDFVPVFEFKEPLENKRPAQGQMRIFGLKSFDLGIQTARHSTIFSAFVAGLGAYGYAGETRNKDEYSFYQKARSEFSLALTASYMHGENSGYDLSVARSIIYFFLGNTYYYLNDLDNAVSAYGNALTIDDQLIEARHNMGVALFLQRNYDAALKNLIKVIQLRTELPIARLNLGVAYLAKKDYSSARRQFQNALKLDPRYAAAYLIIGVTHREEKDYNKAIEFVNKAIEVSPAGKYAEAQVELGLVYYEQGQLDELRNNKTNQDFTGAFRNVAEYYEQAHDHFNQALNDNPSLPEAHFHMARLLYVGRNEDEAGRELLEAVRIRPSYGDAHEILAQIYDRRGDQERRDHHLEMMMKARREMSASMPEDHITRGLAFRQAKNYVQAREEFEKALKLDPRHARALFELGQLYQEVGESEKALSTYQTALKLPAPPDETYKHTADLVFIKSPKDSIEFLRQSVANDPGNPKLHFYLANLYRKEKNDGKAIDSYIKAIQLNPKMYEARNNLAMLYLNRKQINDAILQFKEVINSRERDAERENDYETYFYLGRAYLLNNDVDQTIRALEEAIAIKSDFVEARLLLGEVFLRQAEPERAIEQLNMVQTYSPKDLRARELMGKAYAQAGKLERAIDTFLDIIRVDEDNISAHYNLGVAYVSQKRYANAVQEFIEVVNRKNDDVDSYFNMGVAIYELLTGDNKGGMGGQQEDDYVRQGLKSLEYATQLSPTNPEPYRYLGQYYSLMRDTKKATYYFGQYQLYRAK